jgi:predicted dehydrogenase
MKVDVKYRVAVVGFAHMHVGAQIKQVQQHPAAELVGIWDDEVSRRDIVADDFHIPVQQRYADLDALIARARPDVAIVCSTTSQHTELVERLAAARVHVILEKPFAVSLEHADRMIDSADTAGVLLAVNWPLAWYPPHLTTQRLVVTGVIGDVLEVHYYDGNRGPLQVHEKGEFEAPDAVAKAASWWYSPENGGGSLHDYLGYGATLATWFRSGELPHHICALTHAAPGLRVDEQSVVTAAYTSGLSTFQTKWGTFTDPWTIQPAPACGFVVVGSAGTIVSRDYALDVVVQTDDYPEPVSIPVDTPRFDQTGALAHVLRCLDEGSPSTGPSSKETSRKGQQIVDTAVLSARTGRVSALVGGTGSAGGEQ